MLAALLDIAEHGDGHVYKKDFIRTIRTIKPLGGKASEKDVASLFDSWDASKVRVGYGQTLTLTLTLTLS